jgi:hypothetical protein
MTKNGGVDCRQLRNCLAIVFGRKFRYPAHLLIGARVALCRQRYKFSVIGVI